MTKTAITKKSWRKHPWWRRKPLPDCPLCHGKGLVPARYFSPCGSIEYRPGIGPCICTLDKHTPRLRQRLMRIAQRR
jgi:hypothetical protein